MDQISFETRSGTEAEYCDLEAAAYAELAENSVNNRECSYYRNVEQTWRLRARSLRGRHIPLVG